jgi:hypothetical protein
VSDERETYYINEFNSLYPNGYNLKNGGVKFIHDDISKKKVSKGLVSYYEYAKFERFKSISHIDDDIEKYIKPLKRNNIQYGWYVYINKMKADFGGIHISLEESMSRARDFIFKLKEYLAKYLDAGNSLESSTTTSY